jgi:hypothetical protein
MTTAPGGSAGSASIVRRWASLAPAKSFLLRTSQQSRFVTLRGFTITGAGGTAIHLMGGNNQNEAIHLERNRIVGNGSPECSGGITVNRGNPGTLIANNLIYGNGRHGLAFLDEVGGPHYVVGNTIHANAWTGVWVARDHQALLANNAVTGNGTAAGSTGGRFGITREATTIPDPPGIQLLHNLVCGNRLGEITGPALEATDAGNLTPTGAEGPGVGASPGCEGPATVYAGAAGPDGVGNTGDDDFTLAAASPALDGGIDPRTLGLDPGLHPLIEASYPGPASRPAGAGFDVGAMEAGGGTVSDTQAPTVTFVRPEAAAFVRQSVPVEARATDDGSGVAALALDAGGPALAATLTPAPPAPVVTATATWDTTARPDGAHTLTGTATDGAGNTGSATRVVIVDNTPPDTEVTGGPTGFTTSTAATFTFTGSDLLTASPDLVFAWRLDGAAFSDFSPGPTATASGLTDGAHTFEVKARDRVGNEDPTPAARGVVVDTTAPDTEITGGPTGTIAVTTATVTFTGTDALTATADLVFAWRRDGGAWSAFAAATTVTLDGLGDGPHTVEVTARDLAGHEDPTPAARGFTVDLETGGIWEIKPMLSAEIGWAQLKLYLWLLKRLDPMKRNWHGGSASEYHYPKGPIRLGVGVEAYVFPPEEGLMLYCPVDWGSTIAALSWRRRRDADISEAHGPVGTDPSASLGSLMDLQAAKAAFSRRYYQWALRDSRREVEQDFPFLRAMKAGHHARKVMILMERLPKADQLRLARALVKRSHPEGGGRYSAEDAAWVQRYLDVRLAVGGTRRKLDPRWFGGLLKEVLAPVCGGPPLPGLGRTLWRYARPGGAWVVHTSVDIGARRQLVYHHDIDAGAERYRQEGLELQRFISLISWLGIASTTAWDQLTVRAAPEAAATLARLCAHFLRAAPRLLAGLTPPPPTPARPTRSRRGGARAR